ncbi:histidinol dehydrogenase [Corynebacterium freneyi]|uniref:Histidinol dehydrogenase n=1 Tax=Corynebacterium freneyi DNF00450 TaxID=1287475 RepID=A0A095Y2N9_9CORY|nr:histidinol dehydrogenase [Corynebacterium freneyi]KGF16276.1 histidinol dehydrogenase [Corynebacterium freneyi DNF00450]MDK8768459.1 histidinol dehydrogenase [Corynebacterium freneyi]
MLSTIDLSGRVPSTAELRRALPRGSADVDSMLPTVRPVVEDVAANGAEAAMRYSEKFDGIRPESLVVPAEVIADALAGLDADVRAALEESIARIRTFHEAQKPSDVSVDVVPGGVVKEKWIPVRRVGLYVPGGNAVYPSSVLMNVIPALAAGVESLVVASPPQADFGGWPHPTILAACALLGVTEVWAVGGGQAVALLSYGDESAGLEPVDMVTGPGNIFVTAAKRLCRSVVGIDSEAGPTEIAILADSTADPVAVAYDLISQAEHDVMAASVLITDSVELAEAVDREVEARYGITLNADRVKEALEGPQSGIVLVDDMEVGLKVADAYAAEHLEIHTVDAAAMADRVTNAGAIFVGTFSPVPLGDYSAGSNHVLPTSGTARHSSGLSTHTFLKAVHVVEYDEAALKGVADTVVALADAERLPAHGEAIRARFEDPAAAAENR